MDRFELNSMYKTMLVQKDIESLEGETDIIEIRSGCSGDLCGVSWKPKVLNNESVEDKE